MLRHELSPPSDRQLQKTIDTVAIQQLILRERSARDMQSWEVLASCFTENSRVEMSWFQGSGISFAEESRKVAAKGLLTFHETGPASIDIAGDRAIADTPMAAHVLRSLHGSDVDVTFWTRMRNRAERQPDGTWLLSGLRILYITDQIVPTSAADGPALDKELLASFRPSYRHLSYVLSLSGHAIAKDLPGFDKPETVHTLVATERAWLNEPTQEQI